MANSANKFRTTHLKIWRDNLTVQRKLLINHYMYSTGKLLINLFRNNTWKWKSFSSRSVHWWKLQALTYLYLSLYCTASSPYRFWESFFNFWRVSFFSYYHLGLGRFRVHSIRFDFDLKQFDSVFSNRFTSYKRKPFV